MDERTGHVWSCLVMSVVRSLTGWPSTLCYKNDLNFYFSLCIQRKLKCFSCDKWKWDSIGSQNVRYGTSYRDRYKQGDDDGYDDSIGNACSKGRCKFWSQNQIFSFYLDIWSALSKRQLNYRFQYTIIIEDWVKPEFVEIYDSRKIIVEKTENFQLNYGSSFYVWDDWSPDQRSAMKFISTRHDSPFSRGPSLAQLGLIFTYM